jgi:sugar phosphate isomerase/epimerase
MRLGIPVPQFADPDQGLSWARDHGFGAVYVEERWCPDEAAARAHGARIRAAGLVPAEVGIWCNPISRDPAERARAMERCCRLLALADAAEARCCVNIVGSLGAKWDGPCAEDLGPEAFEAIVASVRAIVDTVQPTATCYTLETMPWMLPDSAESYRELLGAIDRPQVAVHFDPVNLVNSPRRYAANGALIADFVRQLGPRIRSVHVKDIVMRQHLTLHLDECRPGLGGLDHRALLRSLAGLDSDLPLMLEHLTSTEEYLAGAAHLGAVAAASGMAFLQPRPSDHASAGHEAARGVVKGTAAT